MITTYNVLQVFAGAGGGCLGFNRATTEYRGVQARFRTIGAVDSDPGACEALEVITGCKATQMDLFTREQYEAFHGKPPPPDWKEATPADLVAACGGERPDVVFSSPPCKAFSGLLSAVKAASPKYQALNGLVTRWLFLTLEAWADNPPDLLLLENVPRIQTRGRALLDLVNRMLGAYGYAVAETTHDCGELGALGQTRRRFLLVARRIKTCPAYLYEPVAWPLRTIGDVIGTLPPPEAPEGGPLHKLPKLKRDTWVRLAMIRAGKDWRDLKERWAPGKWGIEPSAPVVARNGQRFNNVFRLVDWSEPSPTVTGGTGPSSGGLSVADPRVQGPGWYNGILGVQASAEPSATVTGMARPMTGPFSVADDIAAPRMGQHYGKLRVEDAGGPAHTITGSDRVGSGALSVADPSLRSALTPKSVTLRVRSASTPAPTVTGSSSVWDSGGFAVADPGEYADRWPTAGMVVQPATRPSRTVTCTRDIQSGALSVADPNMRIEPRNGTMGVQDWDRHSVTVTGSVDVQAGTAAIADPRPDAPEAAGPWVLLSDDGTWHRPLTVLELFALQGFPVTARGGGPLVLPGKSASAHRMWGGNAVPPPTAQAIAEQMLATLTVSRHFGGFHLGSTGVWVREAGVLRWMARGAAKAPEPLEAEALDAG